MVRLMREHGVSVKYEELSGKGHWWWDSERANDGGVLNDKSMRRFFRRAFSNPGKNGTNAHILPSIFESVVFNPASNEARAGCRILQQLEPFQLSKISFKREEEKG